MNSAPNRERIFMGFDDDCYVHRVADGQRSGPILKRQDELKSSWKVKPKGQHSYRRGLVLAKAEP